MKLYLPLDGKTVAFIESITVGFKNSSQVSSKKEARADDHADWVCTEGFYDKEKIECRIPNIPQFDNEFPYYMVDVSLNGQGFTDMPHTFRYYFITETALAPHEGLDDAEHEVVVSGKGLFDTPYKTLTLSLEFPHKEHLMVCERNVDVGWSKADKHFGFKMPKLSWIIGDHEITPDLLAAARKSHCSVRLNLGKNETVEVGKYQFVVPPPPPEPEEEKKDAKKDAKKGAKK